MTVDDPRAGSAKLGMVLAMWAECQPDVPAVRSEAGNRSFAELNANVNRLSRALRRSGVADGTSVVVLCSNRPEFVESFAATQRTGLRVTPIDWHLTGEEAGYIVDDCGAEVIIADVRFAEAAIEAAGAARNTPLRIAVGGEIPGFVLYDDLLAGESAEDIDDAVLGTQMMYTSGTTGRPKGVLRDRNAAQSATVVQLVPVAGYRQGVDVHLCTGPLYHAAPLNFSITAPLSAGAGVVLMDGWDAERALDLIDRHGVTHTHMVPTMFQRLLSLPAETRRRYDVTSLRFVIHGAAPCPIQLKKEMIDWWGPIIHEYYAATEGVGALVDSREWLRRPGTVGRPATPDHVRVLDDDGHDVAPGDLGTLYIKAPEHGRFRYHHAPEKTRAAYRGDWYTLGDIGYLDADGWLFLTDRTVDLIVSGGVNIYPAEVESVLCSHPRVDDAAVIGVPSGSDMGEDVLAIVALRPDPAPSSGSESAIGARELIEYCRAHLAGYKCPRNVEVVAELPRTDSGKLLKETLRAERRDQIT